VTAGKALKLNPVQLKNAIGIALGRASGFIVNFGTDAHYIESAAACCDGLMAATLARQGMSGSADLERWLEQLLAGQEFDLTRIGDGLGGDDWRVHEIWVKKYPCCFLTHRHIDMMLETQSERKLEYEDIARIGIDVGPVDHTCNRPRPQDPEDARFSFHHIMAALMLDGDVDSHHFSWEKLADPRFQEAWKKVYVTNHPSWPSEFMSGVAGLTVTLKNGERIVKERAQALGGPKFPLTSVQFMNLYEKYTRHTLNAADIEWTWQVISDLEQMDDLRKLVDRLVFLK
jgi:2-methylcitrate dehydratase PrpD